VLFSLELIEESTRKDVDKEDELSKGDEGYKRCKKRTDEVKRSFKFCTR
jgi:hypothetical protein